FLLFFYPHTSLTFIYTLSLHDALPIFLQYKHSFSPIDCLFILHEPSSYVMSNVKKWTGRGAGRCIFLFFDSINGSGGRSFFFLRYLLPFFFCFNGTERFPSF